MTLPVDFNSLDAVSTLLAQFCAKSSARHVLNTPSRIGKFIYATNGYIVIRILDTGLLSAKNSGITEFTNLERFFDAAISGSSEFGLLPKSLLILPCDKCRRSSKDCSIKYVESSGDVSLNHGNHTYDYKERDGDDKIDRSRAVAPRSCAYCNGDGYGWIKEVEIGGNNFRLDLVYLLYGLHGVKVNYATKTNNPMHFVFDGGEGIIMPKLK